MNKDQIKGKMDDVAGRIKRQAGEWTGDQDLQAEGTKDQAKGKAQNTLGKAKEAVQDIKDDLNRKDRKEDEAA